MEPQNSATTQAHPNIALIKYWGNRDPYLHLPSNGSISINLEGLYTRTSVQFGPEFAADSLILNGAPAEGQALSRVSEFLDRVRSLSGISDGALVTSENNFPMGTGIASSASAFASLALAAASAAGLALSERELSRLARRGSGSACRSIPGGFVEWQPGSGDEDSFAFSLAPADHWRLVDCLAIVSQAHKSIGSQEGHRLADSSPLQSVRITDAPRRLDLCRSAILQRDFAALAAIAELDSNWLHAVTMTCSPPLLYWQPATLEVMQSVAAWRASGTPALYTIDAGPNVHVLCQADFARQVADLLKGIPGVAEVRCAGIGGPAQLLAAG